MISYRFYQYLIMDALSGGVVRLQTQIQVDQIAEKSSKNDTKG